MIRRRSISRLLPLLAWAMSSVCALAQTGLQPMGSAGTPNELPAEVKDVRVVERRGEQVPLHLPFVDSTGEAVSLGRYFSGRRPVVLALVYYDCPVVCGVVMGQLTEAFRGIDFDIGEDYSVVFASIDPSEGAGLAAERKESLLRQYGRGDGPGVRGGWGFLTSPTAETANLARALGWNYHPVAGGEYSHPVCIFVLTPEGRISRYIYGVGYDAPTLRMALLEASEGKISASIGDQIRMYCFRYDPERGRYALAAFRVVQLGGVASMLVIGTLIGVMLTKERIRHRRGQAGPGAAPADASQTNPAAGQTP